MKLSNIILYGYGLSFRQGIKKIDDETYSFDNSKVEPSRLRIGLEDGCAFPFMQEKDGEWVVAIAFFIWVPEYGWMMLDLPQIMKDATTPGEKKTNLLVIPSGVDTSGWKPINPDPQTHRKGWQ